MLPIWTQRWSNAWNYGNMETCRMKIYIFMYIHGYIDTCVSTFIHYLHYNSLCLIEIVYVYTCIHVYMYRRMLETPGFVYTGSDCTGQTSPRLLNNVCIPHAWIITRDDYVDVNILPCQWTKIDGIYTLCSFSNKCSVCLMPDYTFLLETCLYQIFQHDSWSFIR